MSAEQDLREAYREWRRLALAEGEAIQSANWGLLAACQNALANLREQISTLMPSVHQEWAEANIDRAERQEEINVIIRGLIEIARRNQILLAGLRETMQARFKNLTQAGTQLKQLRRSYVPTTLSTWHSLS